MPSVACPIVQDDGPAISVELGRIWSNAQSLGPFRYADREPDEHTELQYNRARHYDPSVGRWLATDPLGYHTSDSTLHRYPSPDDANR